MKNRTITTSSKLCYKKSNQPRKRRTHFQIPGMKDKKCCCKISILFWENVFSHLDARYSCFHHNGHPYVPLMAKNLSSAEISDESAFILQQLSVMGVQKSNLSKLLNFMEDNNGVFSMRTVQNYLKPVTF